VEIVVCAGVIFVRLVAFVPGMLAIV